MHSRSRVDTRLTLPIPCPAIGSVFQGWQSLVIISDHQFTLRRGSLDGPTSSMPKWVSGPLGRNSVLDLGKERTLRRPDAMQKCNSVRVGARDRDDIYSLRANSLPHAHLNVSRAMRSRQLTGRWEYVGSEACGGELRAFESLQPPSLFVILPYGVEHLAADVAMRVVEPDGEDDRVRRDRPKGSRPCSYGRPRPPAPRGARSATRRDGGISARRPRGSPRS